MWTLILYYSFSIFKKRKISVTNYHIISYNKNYEFYCVPNSFRERNTIHDSSHRQDKNCKFFLFTNMLRERERDLNLILKSVVLYCSCTVLNGLATYNKILSVFNQTKLNTREYTWHVYKNEVVTGTGRGSSF